MLRNTLESYKAVIVAFVTRGRSVVRVGAVSLVLKHGCRRTNAGAVAGKARCGSVQGLRWRESTRLEGRAQADPRPHTAQPDLDAEQDAIDAEAAPPPPRERLSTFARRVLAR